MRIATSEIKKDKTLVAHHEIFDGEVIIRIHYSDMGIDLGFYLDTDEALNLKHMLDIALHDKKYSWQGGSKDEIRTEQARDDQGGLNHG